MPIEGMTIGDRGHAYSEAKVSMRDRGFAYREPGEEMRRADFWIGRADFSAVLRAAARRPTVCWASPASRT